jgi:microcystin-dependent protein
MGDWFVGEIRVFGFNFAPVGWARCDGQLIPKQQNTALFQLLGTAYGGDGINNFGLPNLRASVPIHHGQSLGTSEYFRGDSGGTQTVTLNQSEMPLHTHQARASTNDAQFQAPAPDRGLATSNPGFAYQSDDATSLVPMNPQQLGVAGGSQPHNNMQPSLVLNFCIALGGIFPSPS